MNRVSVFARRQRIKKLEKWTMRAIIVECFFLALFPSLAAAAVLLGIITWFLRVQIDTKFKMRSLPFDVPAGLFVLISAISVFASSARSFELIYHFFAFVGIYGLTYILIGQNIRTLEQVKTVIKALSISALIVVLWGYFQYIFGIDTADMKWVDPEKFPELRNRVFSTLENPNVLAGYLDVFICLALGVLAKVSGRTQKLAMVIAIIMLATCLAMTYARGAYLTILIVFVVYGIIQDWRILLLFILVSVALFHYDTTLVDRLTSIFELTDSSQGLRVGIWVSTIAMIADHPFIGIGWGAFKSVYPSYDYYLKGADVIIYHAHNIYLHYAAEIGIVGAMAFFWFFFGSMFMSLELGTNERFQILKEKTSEKLEKIMGSDLKNRVIRLKDEAKERYDVGNEKLKRFIGVNGIITEKLADASERFMNWLSPPSINPDESSEYIDDIDEQLKENEEKPKISLKKKVSLQKNNEVKQEAVIDSDITVVEASADIDTDTVVNTLEMETNADSDVTEILTEISDSSDVTIVEATDKIDENDEIEVNVESETQSAKVINLFGEDNKDEENDSPVDDDVETEEEKNDSMFDWHEVREINNRQIADGVKFGIGLAFLSMALNGLTDDLLFNIPTSMLMWILAALAATIDCSPKEDDTTNRRHKKR